MINRLRKENAGLLMIDIQEKLLPVISGNENIVKNAVKLLKVAELLKIPTMYTEQYPKGIGGTVSPLLESLPEWAVRHEKTEFSCCDSPGFNEKLSSLGRSLFVVFGMESHICVLSSVIDLLQRDMKVIVAADACGSRDTYHNNLAMDEARACGASILPAETIIYQLIEKSGTPEFKAILPILK